MTTAFGTIVGAIETLLQAATPVSSQIFRARLKPIAAQHADAVVIRIESSVPERVAILNAPTDWDTVISIECYARSATLSADEAVDALLANVWAKLAANPSLSGLVMDMLPTNLEYDFAGEADQMACAILTLKVLHRTNNLTLE